MSFPKPLLLALLITACSLPDEVGIGANAGQYDYFASTQGGTDSWPFTNDTGENYGVNAWASWKLKPTKMMFVAPTETFYNPFTMDNTPTINITNKEKEEADLGDHAEDITKVTKNMRDSELLFWGFALILVTAISIFVGPRILEFLKHKKHS